MALTVVYNEPELIRLIALGDEKAFRRIFDHYRNKLYSYSLRITRNEDLAEEIVQDTFLKIWINRTDLIKVERFEAYLYALVRNRAFNSIKRIAHEADIIRDISHRQSEFEYVTEQTVICNDYQHHLHIAVDQLPPQQKKVYVLSRDEGLKYDEIAFRLKLSRNTVKSHLKKATATLRSLFINYIFLIVVLQSLSGFK